jgi:hypothetical protein
MSAAAQKWDILQSANELAGKNREFRNTDENTKARDSNFKQEPVQMEKPTQVLALENELNSLSLPESEDEVKPTYFALYFASETVKSAYNQLFAGRSGSGLTGLPAPTITTDDVGGIMASWKNANKYLVANFGADESRKSFLYWSQNQQPSKSPITDLKLQQQLRWLSEP